MADDSAQSCVVLASLSPAEISAGASRRLSLDDYRAIVAGLDRPTNAQMEAFAEFVCQAHSWYKHLPFYPPGKPLQFFLDPAAGMDLVFRADTVIAISRGIGGFHYSWIPTLEYRQRFGHLAFSRSHGTSVYRMAADGTALASGDDAPAVYDLNSQSLRLVPSEIIEAGVSSISGLVHQASCHASRVLRYKRQTGFDNWPVESGGRAGLQQIIHYCKWRRRQLQRSPGELSWGEDPALARLLAPERHRQRMGMVAAMNRVLALLN